MPKKIKDTFAADLRRLRAERGLRQREVGELLGRTGGRVSQWEVGHHLPESAALKARILEVVASVPNVRGDDVAREFDFARYARLYRADEALTNAVDAVESVDEEWTDPWTSSIEQFHERVKAEMLDCVVTEGE